MTQYIKKLLFYFFKVKTKYCPTNIIKQNYVICDFINNPTVEAKLTTK